MSHSVGVGEDRDQGTSKTKCQVRAQFLGHPWPSARCVPRGEWGRRAVWELFCKVTSSIQEGSTLMSYSPPKFPTSWHCHTGTRSLHIEAPSTTWPAKLKHQMTALALVSFSPPCHHQRSAASTSLQVVLSPLPRSHLKPSQLSSLPWTVTVLIPCFLSLTSEHGLPHWACHAPSLKRWSQILLMLMRRSQILLMPNRPLWPLCLPRSFSPGYFDLPTAPHTSYPLTALPEPLLGLGGLTAAALSTWKVLCPLAYTQPQWAPTHIIRLPAQLSHSVCLGSSKGRAWRKHLSTDGLFGKWSQKDKVGRLRKRRNSEKSSRVKVIAICNTRISGNHTECFLQYFPLEMERWESVCGLSFPPSGGGGPWGHQLPGQFPTIPPGPDASEKALREKSWEAPLTPSVGQELAPAWQLNQRWAKRRWPMAPGSTCYWCFA